MDFNGQYLTYDEFRLLGGTLDIMPFNLLEFEARKIIDKRTLGRLKNVESIPQDVKICINEMIKVINSYSEYRTQNKGIASENTDGYSISYTSANSSNTVVKNTDLEDLIEIYLANVIIDNVPLLYLGVC